MAPDINADSVMNSQDNGPECVSDFYRDQTIFITGGTGFVGKVLLEKLLRSCGSLKRVYLLVRGRNGLDAQTRIENMLLSKAFDRIRNESPASLRKVRALDGDLTLPDLGLSEEDRNTLIEECSIVFHSGATVKFDEPLKRAVQLNVCGTRRVLDLCKEMRHLLALIHVSTAYCNCDRERVEERVYECKPTAEQILSTISWMDDSTIDLLSRRVIGAQPNTYTYTKALAETLVEQETGIRSVIIRPSIITASWKEPYKGWIDNYNGFTGVYVSAGLGLLNSVLLDPKSVADLIPVDIVVNLLIIAAWNVSKKPLRSVGDSVEVFSCTTGTLNPQTWLEAGEHARKNVLRHPLPNVLRYPNTHFGSNRLMHEFRMLFFHLLPAHIIDLGRKFTGKSPKMVPLYHKVKKAMDVVSYFSLHSWTFEANGIPQLLKQLSDADRETFDIDVREIDWTQYFENYVLGIRKFLFREDTAKLSKARTKLRWLYVMHTTVNVMILLFCWRSARKMWYYALVFLSRLYHMLTSSSSPSSPLNITSGSSLL